MSEEADKKWRRRSDARPAELVAAALELFAEQGFAATRLEDVAARAGVSKGTIYRYFQNKEALFEAVVRDAMATRFAEAEALFEVYEGPSADLLRATIQVAKRALEGPLPAMLRLLMGESRNFPELARLWVDLVAKRLMGLIQRILERGIARGEFREVEVEHYVPLVMSPVMFLAFARHVLAGTPLAPSEEAVLDAHLDTLLRGLAPDRPGEPDSPPNRAIQPNPVDPTRSEENDR